MKRTTKSVGPDETEAPSGRDPRFLPVVAAFAKVRHVTVGGKGFGSTGLKVNGKLFAFVSSKGQFVVKVPKERVDELIRAGQAEQFDSGHGRLMKEWAAIRSVRVDWVALAKEAHLFVGGGRSPARRASGPDRAPKR
jgi:hypothetical protein